MAAKNGTQQYAAEYVIQDLKQQVERSTQLEVANRIGVTPQFLNDVLRGRRELSERIARGIGYTRRIVFERAK